MNILITGANGILGRELIPLFNGKLSGVWSPTSFEMDITNIHQMLSYFMSRQIDIVLHCAALTNLKRCEENKKLAMDTNAVGTNNISAICKHRNVPMIYISTDYVFDGTKGNYSESDYENPLSFYAKTKWAGEICCKVNEHRIIRTSFCRKDGWLYPRAFADKYTSGDRVDIIANLIFQLVYNFDKWNDIIHVGSERKSFYELAKKVSPDVGVCSIKDVKEQIPIDTSFDLTKMNKILGK